ncbi:MAG: MarR family transcriptional regulator [Actinomycetota bacterium]|nr:MarR family transcriptional regulator [Actinomycetota bacterium]
MENRRKSTPDPSPSSAQEMVCYRVNLVARLTGQAIAADLAPHGVSPGQLPALLALYEQDGRTQSELAKVAGVEQPTMALTLRRMERDGLVSRVIDETNRRRQLIYLTDRARQVQDVVQSLRQRIDRIAVERLTAKQHTDLQRLLAVMTESLQAHLAP